MVSGRRLEAKVRRWAGAVLAWVAFAGSASAIQVVVSKEACGKWVADDLAACLAQDASDAGEGCFTAAIRDYPECVRQARDWISRKTLEEQQQSAAEIAAEEAKTRGVSVPRFRDAAVAPIMASLPPGRFIMGHDGTSIGAPSHEVAIAYPFSISTGEITESEWNACWLEGACMPGSLEVSPLDPDRTSASASRAIAEVTWNDANAYTEWLSQKTGKRYRLPTEAEWEYAARAGTTTEYFWGDSYKLGAAICENLMRPGRDIFDVVKPGEVKTHPANAFGLFDMSGNVGEWVQDCQGPSDSGEYTDPPTDGSAYPRCESGKRVVRGGSAWSAANCESFTREFRTPDTAWPVIGFRVVREEPEKNTAPVEGRSPSKD